MDTLKVKNFGPIQEANVEFGDLTLLVGPQASGKSLFLQLIKLVADNGYITNTLNKNSYIWNSNGEFLERYFGEGMSQIWNGETKVIADGKEFRNEDMAKLNPEPLANEREKVFYIPAQRVLTLENGWPRAFNSFGVGDPFVIKNFSEIMRLFVELGGGVIFQKEHNPLKNNKSFNDIFYSGEIELDRSTPTKRMVLKINNAKLPFMVWSTGQKESMPLHLSFFHLTYPSLTLAGVKNPIIIIEEPEMGLHPKAIVSVIIQIMRFILMGYRVVVSTHSPVFLEFAWAFQLLKESNAKDDALLDLFGLQKTSDIKKMFTGILDKIINTYYFDNVNGQVNVMNISSLDAGSENVDIADWGGISSFASRAGEIVSKNIPL